MSDESYHPPPISIPIPQSSDIRNYYFNWCLSRSLTHPFQHSHVCHICEYHPLFCTASEPFYVVQYSGSHRFEFLNPDHSFPYLVAQFTILPSILLYLPLMYTTPCSINSCPVIYILWRDLPFFPPNCDLEALEFLTNDREQIAFIQDFLHCYIRYYYSPLAPFTTPLESNK